MPYKHFYTQIYLFIHAIINFKRDCTSKKARVKKYENKLKVKLNSIVKKVNNI